MTYVAKSAGSIAERIDSAVVEALRSSPLPEPIHAINHVRFRSVPLYRLYSILLLPYAIPKGVRPVWVATCEENLLGNWEDDEIVIVEYPDHGTLLDIFTSVYYSRINRLRERGVQHLGFSISEPLQTGATGRGVKLSLGKGSYLVIRFTAPDDSEGVFKRVWHLVEPLGEPAYACREVGRLDIFAEPSPKDPAPIRLPNMLVFEDDLPERHMVEVVETLSGEDGIEAEVQRFRTQGMLEALRLW